MASTLLNGLINFWPLDEATGASRLDLVGAATLTNVNGVSQIDGLFGPASRLTGTSSQKLTNDGISPGENPYSFSMWARIRGSGTGNPSNWLIIKHEGGGQEFLLQASEVSVGATYQLSWRARNQSEIANGAIIPYSSTVWHHIVVSREPGVQIRLIVDNGTPVTTATLGVVTPIAQNFAVGCLSSLFFANIDMVQLARWNRVLTTNEVAEIYNGGAGQGYPYNTGRVLLTSAVRSICTAQDFTNNIGDTLGSVAPLATIHVHDNISHTVSLIADAGDRQIAVIKAV